MLKRLHTIGSLVLCKEEVKVTKGIIRIRISKKTRQKDKQQSTTHAHKTKDRVTRTSLKTGNELRCSGRGSSYCSTSGTRRVNLVTNAVTSGTYPWSFVTQIFHNSQPSHGGNRIIFEVNPWFSSFLVSSNLLSRKS